MTILYSAIMKKNIVLFISILTVVSLAINVVLWSKYNSTSTALHQEETKHSSACAVITAQKQTIDQYWHELNLIGTSANLDRGTVPEHQGGCYE